MTQAELNAEIEMQTEETDCIEQQRLAAIDEIIRNRIALEDFPITEAELQTNLLKVGGRGLHSMNCYKNEIRERLVARFK